MKEGFIVATDTETFYEKGKYSVAGANGMTMRQYCEDPRFDCYLVSFAIDRKVAERFGVDVTGWSSLRYVTPSGDEHFIFATAMHPREVKWGQFDGATFLIHNASFDCEVFRAMERNGQMPHIEYEADDTADMLGYFGIKRALKDGMKHVYGIEVSKEVRSNMDGRRSSDLDPVELKALYEYGTDDSVHCHMLWSALGSRWPEVERKMSRLNRKANMDGIEVNVELVEEGLEHLRKLRADAESKLPWVNSENPDDRYPAASLPALAKWLGAHGYSIPKSFNKNGNDFMDWKKTLDPEKDAELLAILEARIAVTGTNPHIARLETMLAQLGEDRRLHPGFVYFGAHTGRFTAGVSEEREGSKNLNLLNMPKKPVYGVDMRAMYVAEKGRKLVICDYAQVESRTLLWLVDDNDMCQSLMYDKSKGGKEPNLYQLTAVKMGWCKPEDDIKHNDPHTYNMAKQCLTGDTMVLVKTETDSGLTKPYYKRMICVSLRDWLWDGVEWVRHSGVSLMKRVSEHEIETNAGLSGTADHKVYTGKESSLVLGELLGHKEAAAVAWGESNCPVSGWTHVRLASAALVEALSRLVRAWRKELASRFEMRMHGMRSGYDSGVGERKERGHDEVPVVRKEGGRDETADGTVGEEAR